ncbi:unnamed protein product [Rotaria sp. Silwood1]|nr:unnamed protein product [Rotaria sp. Silwood1]
MAQIKVLQTIDYLERLHANESIDLKNVVRTTLKVAPYPYIPDSVGDQYKSLLQYIKTEFENAYPSISLELRPMNASDDFYNISTLTGWLTSDGNEYDVVEVDTILLGDLVHAGLIAPLVDTSINRSDWHVAADIAVQLNQALYGVPHIMCGFFLFTRDSKVASSTTIDHLKYALNNVSTTNYRLVGNLESSWDLPALWMDSYQKTSPSRGAVASALHDYHKDSFVTMRKLAELCNRMRGDNPCLNGTFRNNYDGPALLFANKTAEAMFGYSERLSLVLKNGFPDDHQNINVIPLPSGNSVNQQTFFIDAYVLRRNMSNEVSKAALLFTKFMATPRMQAAVVASADGPYRNRIPRYLLPVSQKAYDEPLLKQDRFYQQYFRKLTGVPYPTVGFLNTHQALQVAILEYVKSSIHIMPDIRPLPARKPKVKTERSKAKG